MEKVKSMFVGDAVALSDEQKQFLENNNGLVIFEALYAKMKEYKINIKTFASACKYHLESRGYQHTSNLGWVKIKDLPRMGIKELENNNWIILANENVNTKTVKIGRRTELIESVNVSIPYDIYLKEEESKKSTVDVKHMDLLNNINEMLGVENE